MCLIVEEIFNTHSNLIRSL